MSRPLRARPAGSGDVTSLLEALRDALDGVGPAVLPVAPSAGAGARGAAAPGGTEPDGVVPDDVAVVVRTSGSTGDPRDVMLTASALRASATATETRLGGPAQWLLALPAHHVAGLQVLVRSLSAGTEPVTTDLGGFTPDAFAAATARLTGDRRCTALVPTQLHRLLDDPAGRAALLGYDAVLLGGAAAPPALLARARAAGARVVTTYGMSETCGGCVYDGVPLDGVEVRVDADGGVLIGGPVLARGYRARPDLDAEAFVRLDGRRLLRTRDVGRLDGGRLTVLGRADDVLVTGGVKVAPAAVERAVAELDGIEEVCVVGVPDDEWGQCVVAVVVPASGADPTLERVRAHVATTLGSPAAPRHLLRVDRLPLRGPGKVDRRAVAELAARGLGRPLPS